jgi:hypothetical protein
MVRTDPLGYSCSSGFAASVSCLSVIAIVTARYVKYDSSTSVAIAITIQISDIVRFVTDNSWLGWVRILGSVL